MPHDGGRAVAGGNRSVTLTSMRTVRRVHRDRVDQDRVEPEGRPGSKPPSWIRGTVALAGLGALVFTGLLMLSDRAPGLSQRLSDRIDAPGSRVGRVASLVPLSQSDTDIHIVAWAALMVAAGVVVWSWRALPLVAGGMFALSLLVEVAQELFTATRGFEISDVVANAIGVAIGAGLMVVLHLVWTALRPGARSP